MAFSRTNHYGTRDYCLADKPKATQSVTSLLIALSPESDFFFFKLEILRPEGLAEGSLDVPGPETHQGQLASLHLQKP